MKELLLYTDQSLRYTDSTLPLCRWPQPNNPVPFPALVSAPICPQPGTSPHPARALPVVLPRICALRLRLLPQLSTRSAARRFGGTLPTRGAEWGLCRSALEDGRESGDVDISAFIVVGAGLGGCAAALALHHHGCDVVVYERLRQFRRLGDSLGLGENALRLLARWTGGPAGAMHRRLKRIGNQAEMMQLRRWDDGVLLAQQPLMDMAGRIGHRGDYHDAFLEAVAAAGVPLHMGREVVAFDEPAAAGEDEHGPVTVAFADSTTDAADVVIGADGIKSRARELVLGFADVPRSSGYACFRAYVSGPAGTAAVRAAAQNAARPATRALLDHDCVNIWLGHDKHLVQNTVLGGAEFNWILTRRLPPQSPEAEARMLAHEAWSRPGDPAAVRALIADLDPAIREAVEATTLSSSSSSAALLDWIICYRDPLPTWVSSRSHRIVLLGDSCHPHLPTSAQGASQAVESAAVLAVCLVLADAASSPNRGAAIALATRTYEKLRFARVRQSQTNGEDVRDRWHSALQRSQAGEAIDPDSVKIRNRWLYALDAEADARARWPAVSAQVADELRSGQITPLCDSVPVSVAVK